jgi:hypothetical protein
MDTIARWLEAHKAEYETATAEEDVNPLPMVEQIAENLSIYAGVVDGTQFIPHVKFLLRSFEASEGRPPRDYLEIEQWCSHHAPSSTLAQ